MRIDVYLHKVCLMKSRTMAKEACERNKVSVNGEAAKPSREVAPGDRIRVDLGLRLLELEVAAVPPGGVSRKDAPTYYRLLADQRFEP